MLALQCPFCGHANQAGAKVCGECAAPLHLAPCRQCHAINDLSATHCYKCGAEFPVRSLGDRDSGAVGATRSCSSLVTSERPRPFEPWHAPSPKRATEIVDALQCAPGEAAMEVQPGAVVAHEPHGLASPATRFSSEEKRAAQVFSLLGTGALFLLVSAAIALVKGAFWLVPTRHSATTAGGVRIARAMLPAFLIAVLAVSGYYAYRSPAPPGGGPDTGQPEAASTSAAIRSPSSGAPARIGEATVSQGAAGISTELSSDPSRSVARPIDDTASQLATGRTHTIEADTAGAETRAPAQPAATSKFSMHAPTAEESRSTAMQTAVKRVVPKQPVSDPSTATGSDLTTGIPRRPQATDSRVSIPPDAPGPQVCTEAIAALGLCKLNTRVSRDSTNVPIAAESRATKARDSIPPNAPRPKVCTEAVAALGLCQLNASAESSTNVPVAAESRPKGTQTAIERLTPKQAVSDPSKATDLNPTTGVLRRSRAADAPRPQVCTEAAAALGLCNLL